MTGSRTIISSHSPPGRTSHPRPTGHRRLGVLTFHRCNNYGSYWQARCLVEGLRARGCDAVILDHDSWRINRAEWACALRPLEPAPTSLSDSLRYAVKMLSFARARSSLPRSERFALEDPSEMESCDLVVVGSDEVWNLMHPWYRGCPLFFGVGARAKRLISYAASFGNYEEKWGLEPRWAEHLRTFAEISVRDANSQRIVESAIGRAPDLVLDPCLQFPLEPQGRWRGPRQPFVAVYGHSFTSGFSRALQRWATARKYRLLSIGYRNDWADVQWLTASPHDFAHCIARAEGVATNFFHGCVFALRYGRPFICEAMPYRSNKVHGLITMLGAEGHLVAGEPQQGLLDARLSEPLEPEIVERLERLRGQSAAYLDRALA